MGTTIARRFNADAVPGTSEAGVACLVGRCECCGEAGVICDTQDGEVLAEDAGLVYVADGRTVLTGDSTGRGWTVCDDCDAKARS